MSWFKDYFQYVTHYQNLYGPKTIVLIQKGSFFECYSYDPVLEAEKFIVNDLNIDLLVYLKSRSQQHASEQQIIGCAIEAASDLGFRLTSDDKKSPHGHNNPFLCGIPTVVYMEKRDILLSKGYTIVCIEEVGKSGNKSMRQVAEIVSPASDTISQVMDSNDHNGDRDYCVSLYINPLNFSTTRSSVSFRPEKTLLSVGMAAFSIKTGNSAIAEIYDKKGDEYRSKAEITRFLLNYQPREVVLHCCGFKSNDVESFIRYCKQEFSLNSIEKLLIKINEVPSEYLSTSYQRMFFSKCFLAQKYGHSPENLQSFSSPVDDPMKAEVSQMYQKLGLDECIYGCASLIALLQHCATYNEKYITSLIPPKVVSENDDYCILMGNAVSQLQIIGSQGSIPKHELDINVFNILNYTRTTMGCNLLRERLAVPSANVSELNQLKEMNEYFLTRPGVSDAIRNILKKIPDLDRLHKKILYQKCTPRELARCFMGHQEVRQLILLLSEQCGDRYYQLVPEKSILDKFWEMSAISDTFHSGALSQVKFHANITRTDVSFLLKEGKSILNTGVDETLDQQCSYLQWYQEQCKAHLDFLDGIAKQQKSHSGVILYFNSKTETMNRSMPYFAMKEATMKKLKQTGLENYYPGHTWKKLKDGYYALHSQQLDQLTEGLHQHLVWINDHCQQIFFDTVSQFADSMSEGLNWASEMSKKIAWLDFYLNNAYLMEKKMYYSSVIEDLYQGASYIDCQELRHPIIETLIDKPYVTNNVSLDETRGRFLICYGVNGAGKSSLVKAVGIAIITSQACGIASAKVKYYPYTKIFTRLTGNDDLNKGRSLFVNEMMEYLIIDRHADNRSLVMCDELCRGTETVSAESISVTAVNDLVERESSAILCTHLHGLQHFETIKKSIKDRRLQIAHLSSHHDAELDMMVYDRILKPGSGSSYYGIEVCKNIGFDQAFIDRIIGVRETILKRKEPKPSHYNKDFYMSECFRCGTTENLHTHHLMEQHTANEQGYVAPGYHKNNIGNLMTLCQECHHLLHSGHFSVVSNDTVQGPIHMIKPQGSP